MKSKFNVWTGLASCLGLLVVAGEALSQTESDAALEEVIVRSHPLSAEGLSQPVTVLAGDELSKALAASLGDTLSVIPGVHSASFGPAVGRPVIRGLSGPRVKIMEDRIDSLDVSISSPDHVTTIEPFAAQSIEVLKGPSTLLYGSGAIGGVVDIHTGRIPHNIPEAMSADLEVRGSDNERCRAPILYTVSSFKLFAGLAIDFPPEI
jgi:iron complex outermembrane receptor protein